MTNYKISGRLDGKRKTVSVDAEDFESAIAKVISQLPGFEPIRPFESRTPKPKRMDALESRLQMIQAQLEKQTNELSQMRRVSTVLLIWLILSLLGMIVSFLNSVSSY